ERKGGVRPVNTGKPYEDITRKIIGENREFFGLNRVEPGPTSVPAIHGGKYKIEVLAYRKGDERLILFECRDPEDRLDQEETGGFAYRIQVTGAAKGYLSHPWDCSPVQKSLRIMKRLAKSRFLAGQLPRIT